ncbi:hypothetical protein OHB26_00260 [Nocardia sp. NBC_01503]|uniref:hypothetical protein n=1 Tax=Nocardia sp. NBC_01503 TaxID=2975997 RepID=UPI002E7C3D18|nr:hypothetical protein [Nocardia sp. NBC_01503]WTL32748.1 hypothetical protein OHB26_00260 [Nocardia sp. NBC_01503]
MSSIEAFLKDPTVNTLSDKPQLSYPVLNAEMPGGKSVDLSSVSVHERVLASQRYVMLQGLVDAGRIDTSTLPNNLTDSSGLKPFDQVKDADTTAIPDILEQHGLSRDQITDYVTNSTVGNQTINDIVFGGSLVQPGSPLFVSVLRGAAPSTADKWP